MIVYGLVSVLCTLLRLVFSIVPSFSNATSFENGFSISYYINYIVTSCAYFLPLTELFGIFTLYLAIINWRLTYNIFMKVLHLFRG